MKKTLLLIVLLAGTLSGFSQKFSIGVKAGLNLAKEDDTPNGSTGTVSTDRRASIVLGGYMTFMINDKFGIQPELLYSGQGGQITSGGFTEKDKFAYLNVPVLFRYQPVPMFNLHTGPQLGLLLSAKESDGTNTVDIKDQVKSSDLGWVFGFGFDTPIKLNFAFRVIAGLGNINKDTSTDKIKNNVIQITVGYKLFGK
jgi:hypothetical protein